MSDKIVFDDMIKNILYYWTKGLSFPFEGIKRAFDIQGRLLF